MTSDPTNIVEQANAIDEQRQELLGYASGAEEGSIQVAQIGNKGVRMAKQNDAGQALHLGHIKQ